MLRRIYAALCVPYRHPELHHGWRAEVADILRWVAWAMLAALAMNGVVLALYLYRDYVVR